MVVSAIAEKLAGWMDPKGKIVLRLTATQVLERMGFERPTNAQAKECAAALRDMLGEAKRINGINKWSVSFNEPPANAWQQPLRSQEDEIY